jgi:3-hydroxyacyl-[acyl-carrier-protein] dehydratase
MRWIWIDRFERFEPGVRARAVKALSWTEDVFAEHVPGYPIMPAALMLEGLAQTGGILVGEARKFRENVVLAKIARSKFHREAMPGEMLHYDVEVVSIRDEGAIVQGRVSVGEELIGEAEITFAHVDASKLGLPGDAANFVFGGGLKLMLDMARAATPANPDAASG